MVHHSSWLRPKTSSGLPSSSSSGYNNQDHNTDTAERLFSRVTYISPGQVLAPASTTPAQSTINTSTSSGRIPTTDKIPSLTSRRSTHEFFVSARDNAHHVASRPRPASSYLIPSFGVSSTHSQSYTDSFSFHSSSSTSTHPNHRHHHHTNTDSPLDTQPLQLVPHPRSRFRAGIEEARGALSYMARKALHNSSRSTDMRPIDRLATHDSTLSTVIASSGSSTAGSSAASVVASTSTTFACSSRAATASTVSSRASTAASSTAASSTSTARPASKSIRRLRSLRDRSSRMFLRGGGNGQERGSSFFRANFDFGDRNDDENTPMEQDGGVSEDVLMTNAPMPPWQGSAVPGSAARAAAAEHNHTKAASHSPVDAHSPQHALYDDDEEMSDDVRIVKKRRGGNGKFASVLESGDNGYDSMEVDNGVDEFTDRRRSKPPARTDLVGKLPTEIAAAILSYLDDTALTRCAKVSRRWNELALSPAVWRESFLGRYARAEDNTLPYIQFGGQGLGSHKKQTQQWLKMSRARRQIEKNWRASQPKAVYFVGHTDSVYCCQFDEDKIITGSRDRTIRVWDLTEPYACRKVIGGPAARPVRPTSDTPLETHPTNTVHQSNSLNGTPAGDDIYHIPADYHTASILCLQFDKEIMVTGSSDHSCIVWDMKTFEPIRRLLHHTAGVLDVCMDDEYIISCSKDAHICVWDRKTFSLIKALHGHRGPVNAVQLREINGRKLLVSASGDGLAKIWDLKKLEAVQQFNSQDRGLAAVEFSDDGRFVLAGGNDQVIYKFDSASTNLEHTFRGHSSLVRSLFLDSANGRIVSGSYDQGIRVYDFNNGELIGSYDNWTTSWILAAKSDYRRIVATSQDGRALLMDFGWGVEDAELLAGMKIDATKKGRFEPNSGGTGPQVHPFEELQRLGG